MCVLIFLYSFSLKTFIVMRRIRQDMIKMYLGFHIKYLLLLLYFNETWIFWTYFRDIELLIKLLDSPSSGRQIVHAD